jgi:hypothetical protein
VSHLLLGCDQLLAGLRGEGDAFLRRRPKLLVRRDNLVAE